MLGCGMSEDGDQVGDAGGVDRPLRLALRADSDPLPARYLPFPPLPGIRTLRIPLRTIDDS